MRARIFTALLATTVAAMAFLAMPPADPITGGSGRTGVIAPIETIIVQPGRFAYRLPGEFLRAGRPVDGPVVERHIRRPVEIMAYQVSAGEYAACVADSVCLQPDGPQAASGDQPVTGIGYNDALAYARWLSHRTGDDWRLPTDEEWSFAAAERFGDDAVGLEEDTGANPAARWLAAYRNRSEPDKDGAVKPRGHFGSNSNGLYDLSGSVWEWTTTCYARNRVGLAGRLDHATENCGVRVVGGRHRSYMSFFLRDGKSGGCAAGMAPDNLGLRLVRVRKPAPVVALVRRMLDRQPAG